MFKPITFQTPFNTINKTASIDHRSLNTDICFKGRTLTEDTFVSRIDRVLETIPEKDQKILSSFFHVLIEEFEWGYTLFGSKPISNTDGETEAELNTGWKVWEKHKDKFPSNNFIIRRNNDEGICIINKNLVKEKVKQHIGRFKETLGDSITPKAIIKEFEKNTSSFNDTALNGILYGYGEKNSVYFKRLFEISDINPAGTTISDMYVANMSKTPSEGFNSIEEELNHLIKELYANNFENIEEETIPIPIFCAIESDPETIALKANYKQQQAEIRKINNDPNFLKLVLKQLSSYH